MNPNCYQHVLFKDLKDYLKRADYLSGFTTTEQSWIRTNIGAISQLEANKLAKQNLTKLTYDDLYKLISDKDLAPGSMYLITDFQTIYSSPYRNNQGQLITWGLIINPSKTYNLLVTAYSKNILLPQAYILDKDEFIVVNYDVNKETLEDGISTKGKITYMLDMNRNQANFDFKNKIIVKDNKNYYLFSKNQLENSNNCFDNNCCEVSDIIFLNNSSNTFIKGSNIIINNEVSNLFGTLVDKNINIPLNLSDNTYKYIINAESKDYIDYLDLETLTHQFYEL